LQIQKQAKTAAKTPPFFNTKKEYFILNDTENEYNEIFKRQK